MVEQTIKTCILLRIGKRAASETLGTLAVPGTLAAAVFAALISSCHARMFQSQSELLVVMNGNHIFSRQFRCTISISVTSRSLAEACEGPSNL